MWKHDLAVEPIKGVFSYFTGIAADMHGYSKPLNYMGFVPPGSIRAKKYFVCEDECLLNN